MKKSTLCRTIILSVLLALLTCTMLPTLAEEGEWISLNEAQKLAFEKGFVFRITFASASYIFPEDGRFHSWLQMEVDSILEKGIHTASSTIASEDIRLPDGVKGDLMIRKEKIIEFLSRVESN